MPWHVRIHRIKTAFPIDIADGGFAISLEEKIIKYNPKDIMRTNSSLIANFPWGVSGVVNELDGGQCELVKAYPNTNLIDPVTLIPTLKKNLSAGEHILIHSFIGDVSNASRREAHLKNKPVVKYDGNRVMITSEGETIQIE